MLRETGISNGAWWRTRILSASSLADLGESLAIIVQRIGFRYFVFRGRYPQTRSGQHEVRLDNCPAGWFDYCSEHGFATATDPIHQRAMQEATPVLWRDWFSHYPNYFAAARKFTSLIATRIARFKRALKSFAQSESYIRRNSRGNNRLTNTSTRNCRSRFCLADRPKISFTINRRFRIFRRDVDLAGSSR